MVYLTRHGITSVRYAIRSKDKRVRAMIFLFIAIAAAVAATGVIQTGINSDLKVLVGNPYQAALISTTVSTLFLICLSTIMVGRPYPEMHLLREAPWWMWTGGIIGALFVAATAALVSKLGSSVMFTVIILGQLAMAVAMDHYGWFGLDKHPISALRLGGIFLVILGVVVVRRT